MKVKFSQRADHSFKLATLKFQDIKYRFILNPGTVGKKQMHDVADNFDQSH